MYALILCSVKTPENQRFFDVFRGDKMGTLTRNELRRQKKGPMR